MAISTAVADEILESPANDEASGIRMSAFGKASAGFMFALNASSPPKLFKNRNLVKV